MTIRLSQKKQQILSFMLNRENLKIVFLQHFFFHNIFLLLNTACLWFPQQLAARKVIHSQVCTVWHVSNFHMKIFGILCVLALQILKPKHKGVCLETPFNAFLMIAKHSSRVWDGNSKRKHRERRLEKQFKTYDDTLARMSINCSYAV